MTDSTRLIAIPFTFVIIGLGVALSSASRMPSRGAADSTLAQPTGDSVPIYGIRIPQGYRDWQLISIAPVGEPLDDMHAKLGNVVAITAYRTNTLPFADGTIIARLAWKQAVSEENKAISPVNVQFMVKDSKRYASTGGWGFAQFTDGKPDGEAVHKTCFACHAQISDRDFVFTRYSP